MSKQRSVRALLVCVPMVCILSSAALQAQWADYMELTCAAPGGKTGFLKKALNKFKEIVPGFSKESPICGARTQEALVLLTGVMLDRAALAAAQGLDEVQVALAMKQTLVLQIEELKRAVGGLGTGG